MNWLPAVAPGAPIATQFTTGDPRPTIVYVLLKTNGEAGIVVSV